MTDKKKPYDETETRTLETVKAEDIQGMTDAQVQQMYWNTLYAPATNHKPPTK